MHLYETSGNPTRCAHLSYSDLGKKKPVLSAVAGNCQDYSSTISQLSPFVSLSFSRDRLFLMAGKIPSKAVIPHRKPEV